MSPAVRIAYYCATFAFVHQAEVKGWLGVELYNAGNMWRSQKAYVAQDIDWYGNGSATQGQVTTAARNWYNTTLGTCPAQYGLCGVGQVDSNPSGPTLCIAAEVP